MHPGPPKRQDELSESVEMRQGKMRRSEAHGDEYKLAPVFQTNALRMLMTDKAKEHFDLWEADRDHPDAAKSYEDLLQGKGLRPKEKVGQHFLPGEDAARRRPHGR